jgi:hypothetical protein
VRAFSVTAITTRAKVFEGVPLGCEPASNQGVTLVNLGTSKAVISWEL